MTGSLSIRGEVLPVGGVTAKVEAAIKSGIKEIIIPEANAEDLVLDKNQIDKIKIHKASRIKDVLKISMNKRKSKKIISKF